MKSIRILSVFLILSILSTFSFSQSIEDLISEGDSYYKKWENQKALESFLKAYELDNTSFEAAWRLSRTYADLGEKAPKKPKEDKKALYEKGVEFGHKAVALNPDHAEGHLRLAISTGRLALFHGGKTKIRMSKQVKAQIDTVKMLDPDHFLGYYVIGRWHREISGLSFLLKAAAKIIYGGVPKASKEEAIANFEKTVELNPAFIEGNVALANMYIKKKRYEEARMLLRKAIDSPKMYMNDDDFKKEAEETLEKIKNKK
ncbi:tetratricopeptide repeat protein [candidate division KSB1 bacterium]